MTCRCDRSTMIDPLCAALGECQDEPLMLDDEAEDADPVTPEVPPDEDEQCWCQRQGSVGGDDVHPYCRRAGFCVR